MTWPEVEAALRAMPRPAMALFAARAARRVMPAIAKLEAKYGPEALEWLAAIDATLRVVEAFARGEPVTRFTLDVVADVARCAAHATANAARTHGPSPLIEDAELAYAAAAFAADCARADDRRAVALAVQSAKTAVGGGDVPAEQATDVAKLPAEPGPLWPHGEPGGWTALPPTRVKFPIFDGV